jgi:hypothetical protein
MDIWRYLRNLILTLLTVALLAGPLAACDGSNDDATARPPAVKSPVNGQLYCPWVENSHECDDSPYEPAAFAMPTDRPVRDPGMSTEDFLLLMLLFDHHTTYGPSYYDRSDYYRGRIGPAWRRYPGRYNAYPGGRLTVQHITVNNYTGDASKFESKYAPDIKAHAKDAHFVTASGKPYKGTQVPVKAFSGGTTVPPEKKAANTGDTAKKAAPAPADPKRVKTGDPTSPGKSGYGSTNGGQVDKSKDRTGGTSSAPKPRTRSRSHH